MKAPAKRRSTRTRQGAPWLKTTLVQAAWAAARKKDSYFHGQFLRLKSRRGPKKAILAVAASMLTDVYYMLRDGVEFHDLGDRSTSPSAIRNADRQAAPSAAPRFGRQRGDHGRMTRTNGSSEQFHSSSPRAEGAPA